jgi:hypothetical protein
MVAVMSLMLQSITWYAAFTHHTDHARPQAPSPTQTHDASHTCTQARAKEKITLPAIEKHF